jgi:hypothetical protein
MDECGAEHLAHLDRVVFADEANGADVTREDRARIAGCASFTTAAPQMISQGPCMCLTKPSSRDAVLTASPSAVYDSR